MLRLAALAAIGLTQLSGATLYMAAVDGPGDSGFVGQVNRNQLTASYSFSGSGGTPQSVASSWSGSVNLADGTLHQFSTASNNGLDPTIQHLDSATIDFFADTFHYGIIGSGSITIQMSLDGSFTSHTTGLAEVINSTYMRLYFLQPGSLDDSSILDPTNIIDTALFGVGPNFQDNPYFSYGTPNGIMSLPGSVSYSVPTSQLPDGFQLLVLLQTYIVASTGPGGAGTFDYTMDLGNTAHINMLVPEGTTVTADGGLPVASEVPEPASWMLMLGGAAVAGLLRRGPEDAVNKRYLTPREGSQLPCNLRT